MKDIQFLLLGCFCCTSIITVGAYHSFLRELLQPFMTCAVENNIPRDKSRTGNLNNDIDTLRIGYDLIMPCVDNKLETFRASPEPMKWYIGYMFDLDTAKRLKSNLTSYAYDFSCLDSDSSHYSRDVCFNSSHVAISKICEIAHQYNATEDMNLQMICNGGTFMRPGNCGSKVGDPCVPGVSAFLQDVLFPILVGKECESSLISPINIPEIVTSGNRIRQSAIFACGQMTFKDTLEQLFPPSESTVTRVTNITAAKIQHQLSLTAFCGKRQEYVQCLSERLQNPDYIEDLLIRDIIDVYGLEKAFDVYCQNQDLISSQYECTYSAMSSGKCFGGVEDLLSTGVQKLNKMSSVSVCREMKSAISCRLQTQLNSCSPQFTTVMEQFYDSILPEHCYPYSLRPNPLTDMPICIANYSLGVQKRVANQSDVMVIIAKEVDYFCKNEVEDMTDCMYEIYSNPKKPYDVFSAKIFAARNIKPLYRIMCDLTPALKTNMQCMIKGFEVLANQSGNCLLDLQEKKTKMGTNVTAIMHDYDKTADLMCGLLGSLKPCVTSVSTSCDTALGKSVASLFDEMTAACNNPSYQIKVKDGISSASTFSGTIILFASAVMFSVL